MTDIRDEVAAARGRLRRWVLNEAGVTADGAWSDELDVRIADLEHAARGLTVVREGEIDVERNDVDAALFRAASNVTTLCLNHGINPRQFVAAIEAAREYARLARQPEGQ
jgi:hypothetical protein